MTGACTRAKNGGGGIGNTSNPGLGSCRIWLGLKTPPKIAYLSRDVFRPTTDAAVAFPPGLDPVVSLVLASLCTTRGRDVDGNGGKGN